MMFLILLQFLLHISHSASAKQPHIIFILADDLGWNDVSFHGSEDIPTPHIDLLGYSGIILNNYYVSPICTPSRSALLTGKHPIHTGMQHGVIQQNTPYGLPLAEKLLPSWLNNLGYESHMVGKWHLGNHCKVYTPTYRGFTSHFGFWGGAEDYYTHTYEKKGKKGFDFRRNMSVAWDTYGSYSTGLFTNEAVRIIEAHNADTPLFLYLAHQAVHVVTHEGKLEAPKQIFDMFTHIEGKKKRTYAAMIHTLDSSVGRVFEALYDNKMLEDSIIIFSTDNGGYIEPSSNWPLRGMKKTLWEGGLRGVGLIWSPRLQKRERVSNQLMHIQDWLPTIYSAAGGNVEDLGSIDGVDMWESLSQDLPSPRHQLLHNIDPISGHSALRKKNWKLISGNTKNKWFGVPTTLTAEIPAHLKLRNKMEDILELMEMNVSDSKQTSLKKSAEVICGTRPTNPETDCNKSPCLYNIYDDPCEYQNVADEHPDIVEDLLLLLQSYGDTAVPPKNEPVDPNANPKFYNNTLSNWLDFV